MEFTIQKGENRFFIEDQNHNLMAEITYFINHDGDFVANHTFVSPDFRGLGIARKLVEALVEEARNENKRIIPVCSYVGKLFLEDAEFKDVAHFPKSN